MNDKEKLRESRNGRGHTSEIISKRSRSDSAEGFENDANELSVTSRFISAGDTRSRYSFKISMDARKDLENLGALRVSSKKGP